MIQKFPLRKIAHTVLLGIFFISCNNAQQGKNDDANFVVKEQKADTANWIKTPNQFKAMYLAKRHPSLNRDAFLARWRMHGAKAMSSAFWKNTLVYVQAEPVIISGFSDEYDAVSYNTKRIIPSDSLKRKVSSPDEERDKKMTAEDELKTFATPIKPDRLFFADEYILKDGEPGGITVYLFFKNLSHAKSVAITCQEMDNATRIVFNTKRDDPNSLLPYEAIVEVTSGKQEDLIHFFNTKKDLIQYADVAVIAKESVLWDRSEH